MNGLTPEKKAEIAKRFTEAIPHSKALGMELTRIGNGEAFIEMPYDERFIGDPRTGVIHGGAVSALLDTCCGASVMSHSRAPAITATIDLRIDYMRPATPGQKIRAHATCYRVTKSVAFVRAVAMDDDDDRPVATAAGTFTADHAPGRKSSEALS
ncbi:PaaI family thioesterase [Aliiroseovarius sp.]|uniref:PaaI family thioesterase n=1 Tax=Aliiroseovarius sp. TaxID=1872442 RepID=UPI0026177BD5|nr:PaaI family thioesterase [Aliiroseovarius sp.]